MSDLKKKTNTNKHAEARSLGHSFVWSVLSADDLTDSLGTGSDWTNSIMELLWNESVGEEISKRQNRSALGSHGNCIRWLPSH